MSDSERKRVPPTENELAEYFVDALPRVAEMAGNDEDGRSRLNFYGQYGVDHILIGEEDQPRYLDTGEVVRVEVVANDLSWCPGLMEDPAEPGRVILEVGKRGEGDYGFMVGMQRDRSNRHVAGNLLRPAQAVAGLLETWQAEHFAWEASKRTRDLVLVQSHPITLQNFEGQRPFSELVSEDEQMRYAQSLVDRRLSLIEASQLLPQLLGAAAPDAKLIFVDFGVRNGRKLLETPVRHRPEVIKQAAVDDEILAPIVSMVRDGLLLYPLLLYPTTDERVALLLWLLIPTNTRVGANKRPYLARLKVFITNEEMVLQGAFRDSESGKWANGLRVISVEQIVRDLGGAQVVLPEEVRPKGIVMPWQRLKRYQVSAAVAQPRVRERLQAEVARNLADALGRNQTKTGGV